MRLPGLRQRRKFWLEIHLWLGLALGLFLSIFGITGAVLVFQAEIDDWLNPQLYDTTVPAAATPQPLDDIVAAAVRAAPPGWESGGAQVPDGPGRNYVFGFWVKEPTPAPERAVSINIAVDPYTAEVVGRRVFYHAWNPLRHCFIGFFFKLHYALFLGDTGGVIVGVMGVLLILSALAGLILWWPLDGKWRRVLTLKRGAGSVRLNHDLHQSGGFYSLLVLLAVLLSGLYFNLPDQFSWLVGRFSPLTPPPAAAAPVAVTGSIDAALAAARAAYPGGRFDSLSVPDPNTGLFTACFRDVPELASHVIDTRCLVIDRASQRVLQVQDPAAGSGGDTFMQWQWPLHSGKAFGWTGRILVFICGLLCPVLFVTGVIRWLQKRRARRISDARREARLAGA